MGVFLAVSYEPEIPNGIKTPESPKYPIRLHNLQMDVIRLDSCPIKLIFLNKVGATARYQRHLIFLF